MTLWSIIPILSNSVRLPSEAGGFPIFTNSDVHSNLGVKMAPNIFNYATKELSQDAVICWLVACANEPPGQLRECGEEFVKDLMRCGDNSIINATNGCSERHADVYEVIEILEGPTTQYRNIDVYFRAAVDEEVVSFIIEDKIHGEMHGDQLKRYLDAIQHDRVEEDLIKPIYFKTGYVFQDEREQATEAQYSVFDSTALLEFLDSEQRVDAHLILEMYAEHLRRQMEEREYQLENYDLNQNFVQWEFMVRLREGLPQLPRMRWPARYNNKDGSAWTQYPHYDDDRVFFWRLDANKWRPALYKPLRLMVNTKAAGLNCWDEWYQFFEAACKEAELSAVPFRRVRTRNGKPVSEGTIGAVDIKQCLQDEGWGSVAKVANLHNAFFRSVDNQLS